MATVLHKPSAREKLIARKAYQVIQDSDQNSETTKKMVHPTAHLVFDHAKKSAELPTAALSILKEVLENMAEGKAMLLFTPDKEISTQQAADVLGVSRPHLVKLLETGRIPHRKVGSHRRIRTSDLIRYEKKLRKTRREKLTFLAQQAQELKLGYE